MYSALICTCFRFLSCAGVVSPLCADSWLVMEAVCVNTMLMSVSAPQSSRMTVVKASSWFVMEGNLLRMTNNQNDIELEY